MNAPLIDELHAVEMHKGGLKVPVIAERLQCERSAIYRAFKRQGYVVNPGRTMRSGLKASLCRAPGSPPIDNIMQFEEDAIAARRQPSREPCFRCGTRGDIGCGCSKVRLGWSIS